MLTYTEIAIPRCLPVYAKETALQGHLQMQGGWGDKESFCKPCAIRVPTPSAKKRVWFFLLT
jgi:hypothetical protein